MIEVFAIGNMKRIMIGSQYTYTIFSHHSKKGTH